METYDILNVHISPWSMILFVQSADLRNLAESRIHLLKMMTLELREIHVLFRLLARSSIAKSIASRVYAVKHLRNVNSGVESCLGGVRLFRHWIDDRESGHCLLGALDLA